MIRYNIEYILFICNTIRSRRVQHVLELTLTVARVI